MSWSCPFHSFQLPLHVPVIFSVCPLHFPCMSGSFVASQFPTSPVVPIGCLVLCFPLIPPALPLFSLLSVSCPFQFPFVSLSFPVAFLSCRLPISSPHFLALPCISPVLPIISRKKARFFLRFRKEDVQKHRVFPDSAKGERAGRGDSSLGPVWRHRLPEDYIWYQTSGGGGLGGVILYPLLGVRHAEQRRRICSHARFLPCVQFFVILFVCLSV